MWSIIQAAPPASAADSSQLPFMLFVLGCIIQIVLLTYLAFKRDDPEE